MHDVPPGVQDLVDFLAMHSGCDPEELVPYLYTYHDDAAVSHLFAVAAGIDSMILGESEVLGQVREAWLLAEGEGTVRQTLGRAFRHAVEVGKRVRTETAIARGPVSMSTTAVAVAVEQLGSLAGANVVVVGAGVMGEGIALGAARRRRRRHRGGQPLAGAGRRAGRPHRRTGRRPRRRRRRPRDADVLLTSTGSSEVVVVADDVATAMHGRANRPLLVIDIAVPRDVDPPAADVAGVTIVDLSRLEEHAAHASPTAGPELPQLREIIGEELGRYRDDGVARRRRAARGRPAGVGRGRALRRTRPLPRPPGRPRRPRARDGSRRSPAAS